LLTPKNAALLIIDYQPIQVSSIMSMDRELLVENIVRAAKTAKAYGLPAVVSTVNVKTGINKPLIPQLQEVFPGIEPLDRATINAWEDVEFLAAVKSHRPEETPHDGVVDGSLPCLSGAGCLA